MYALMAALAQTTHTSGDGLTFAEILAAVPHDAAAIVVYLLSAGAVGWVIRAGMRKGPGKPDAGTA